MGITFFKYPKTAGAEQPFPTCQFIKFVFFQFSLNSNPDVIVQTKTNFRSGRVALRPLQLKILNLKKQFGFPGILCISQNSNIQLNCYNSGNGFSTNF